jgi:streptomycin 6-kinase
MSSDFINSLPSELVTHVTSICGQRGARWLDDLEQIVGEVERMWRIKVGKPFSAGEYNFVAPANREDGELTVLKISPPFKTIEIFDEAAFLRNRNGKGAVKLLAEVRKSFSVLLEHAVPGNNLAELFADDQPAAIGPAFDVLRSIVSPVPDNSADLSTLDEWFAGMRRYKETKFPADYATKAFRIYEKLSTQPNRSSYLHGDFHPGNVVSATRAPFLAIDPKGIIGHIGYDIAVFLNNFHWWQEKRHDVGARLEHAVHQFAEAFEMNSIEIRQWAFAQMVLGAWWNFQDMPELYNNEVAKADIWDV